MRTCPRCQERKELDAFRPEPSRSTGVCPYCRDCEPAVRREKYLARRGAHNAYSVQYQKARPGKRREYQRRYFLRKTYGLSEEDIVRMVAEQDGRCAVCRTEFADTTPHVDHHHETGRVRGLLCNNCNRGIGWLQDDTAILARAIEYLTEGVH